MDLKALFAATKTIAIVGMSTRPDRPSHMVATYMQNAGYRIIPVNPAYAGQQILGESCVATLAEAPVPVDIVDCFRRSEEMVEVARAAAGMHPLPNVLWMQLGVQNEDAAKIAREAGMDVIQNQCVEVEFMALQRQKP
jgi:predicted CoA-binding protein